VKNFLRLLIVFFVCVLLGLWSPWLNLKLNFSELFGVATPNPVSGLEVNSLSGEIDVFIDGEFVGSAKENTDTEISSLLVDAISPGEHPVKLVRKTEIPGAYHDFEKVINFQEGINVVVSFSIGPEPEFTEGQIITARPRNSETHNLEISLNQDKSTVIVNGISTAVLEKTVNQTITFDKQSEIRIAKPGFEEIQFKLLPEDEAERKKLETYIIEVDAYLMLQPVQVE
jgi:hypothetical protein